CIAEYCFHFDNTDQIDLMGVGWFDPCVDMPGDNVSLIVRDGNGMVVYEASGPKNAMWTYDQLTSTNALNQQYAVNNHNRPVLLDNGDLLRISGKNANNSGCGGSLGNGYVIVVYDAPIQDTYYYRIKLLIAPYNYTVGQNGARSFGTWSPGAEISWNNDMDQNSCFPNIGQGPGLNPFLGSFDFVVY